VSIAPPGRIGFFWLLLALVGRVAFHRRLISIYFVVLPLARLPGAVLTFQTAIEVEGIPCARQHAAGNEFNKFVRFYVILVRTRVNLVPGLSPPWLSPVRTTSSPALPSDTISVQN